MHIAILVPAVAKSITANPQKKRRRHRTKATTIMAAKRSHAV
jgi:hypothetical protein